MELTLMARITGVFGNDSDLERALNELHERQFEDVRVMGTQTSSGGADVPLETYLGGIGAANAPTQSGAAVPFTFAIPAFGLGRAINEQDISSVLDDEGIRGAEADFYAERLRRGGKLVIVDTSDDRADVVRAILRRTNASNWTHSA
jgi:hypothetical protein